MLIKKSLLYFIFSFLFFIIWNYIADGEIEWSYVIQISITISLIYLFYEWVKVPYQWKKDKDEEN
ncbi:hypothetical protein [Ornithinibacillus halotolerans]|uniref:Uncharacterized protein n=1 Tax=Ornithinibacillus halotolerans TaxID=1274357 RepID=A0A916W1P3_9BACI|nr:hypothetical protein [Ornithinibacillus halotolerans]GGA60434.1 hypothetical protein GCM10008025_00570 [Ornithinibacillus halotolerans]